MAPLEEVDALGNLEERITRAVELVMQLRKENENLAAQLERANASRETAVAQAQSSTQELEDLRAERKQVRTRIEKLLGQMDLLSAT